MIELWIAIDEKVIEWEPYLKNYTPEIPSGVLEPLLLPRRDQMERLSRAEVYLQKRHKAARGQSAIFYNTADSSSFANWFVNQSQSLQATIQEIKEEAVVEYRCAGMDLQSLARLYPAVSCAVSHDSRLDHTS